MKNIVKILMLLSLTVFCLGANAQSTGDNPMVGATHRYVKGELTDASLASSKYLWMVLKDGAIADRGEDYVFVTGKEKDATVILGDIPVVANIADIVVYDQAKAGYNQVFIKWLKPGDYKVVGNEFDEDSKCYDVDVNKEELVVTAVANAFDGSVAWNGRSSNTYTTAEYDSDDTSLFPCATLTDVEGTVNDKTDDKTRIPFDVNAVKYVGHYHFKYKFLVKYINSDKTTQTVTDSGSDKVLKSPTDLEWAAVAAEKEAFDNNALKMINIDTDIEQGDGRAFVWVKITYMVDDNNLEANNLTTLVRCAVLNQLPTPKPITFD